ncbi:Protein of unknown function (DUF788) domain containing protein [Naviculisporaceae sp. PSN 640]
MAQKARKELAKANIKALNNLHIGSAIVNFFFLLVVVTFDNRSVLAWIVLSIPSLICQYVLEKSGRPDIDEHAGVIRSAGEDLSAPGLTEYMWDVVWVTWGVAVLVIFFGDKLWTLWAIVPAYGLYKGVGLLGAAKQMAGLGSAAAGADDAAAAPAGNRKQRRAAAGSS